MSNSAKKVGAVARFGPRYGVRIRSRMLEVEKEKIRPASCPRCGTPALDRTSTAIWECRHCGYKYAARAFSASYRKIISSEQNAPAAKEED